MTTDHILAGQIVELIKSKFADGQTLAVMGLGLAALGVVLAVLIKTRSWFKTGISAVGMALMMWVALNMTVLREKVGTEFTSAPAISVHVTIDAPPSR